MILFGFIETRRFTGKVGKLLAEDEYAEIQLFLCEHPDFGKIIKGSGGIRKARCGVGNRGKSGGARIIYYWAVSDEKIIMLDIYAKNEKENLSPNEIQNLRRKVQEFLR